MFKDLSGNSVGMDWQQVRDWFIVSGLVYVANRI